MKNRKPTSAKHPKPTPKQSAPPTTTPTSTTTTSSTPSTTTTTILSTTQPTPSAPTATNALDQPGASLQKFSLADLAQFTKEHTYSTMASKNFHLFYVGRDNVHLILKYVLSRVTVSLHLNMFGYDDDELNDIIEAKMLDRTILVMITLDRSQAGGKHEKALIALDQKNTLASFNTHFVVGTSATGQISHTKGFVADGIVAAEGSTNWSTSGEGTFIVTGQAGGPNYKAQNNTQSIITDIDTVTRFQSELITEHLAAQRTARDNAVAAAKGAPAKKN
jgi:hypothetical protein